MERVGRKGCSQIESNNLHDEITYISNEVKSISSNTSSSSSSSSCSSPSNNFNYNTHEVCRMDTVAGIAIKYGVEIADVRRLNGLATDLHIFAHKTLRIPSQGRHPMSHDVTEKHGEHRKEMIDGFESFNLKPPHHPKILHGNYGLPPVPKRADFCLRNEDLLRIDKPSPNKHRRSQSLLIGQIIDENGDCKRSIRQRQRTHPSPEVPSHNGTVPIIASLLVDKLLTIRKSSSTSSLHDFDNGASYSLFAATSKWNLMPDTFAFPGFDGFRNPIASWTNKFARD